MKSRHWWIRNLNIRRLRRYVRDAYQSGFVFSLEEWGEELSRVRELKPGDFTFSLLSNEWKVVREVRFCWSPVCYRLGPKPNKRKVFGQIKRGRVVGRWVCGFVIILEDGTWIYESTELCEEYLGSLPINKNLIVSIEL